MKKQTRIGLAVGLTLALLAGLAPRAEAANKYWIATSAANWNNTANWSLSSGGTGNAGVPGANDVAIFDGGGGANGNCNVDATVNQTGTGGFNIGSGYSGTISQGAVTITVGSTGWTQAGGTFNGGSNPIAINGPVALSGGTFKSTSGTLTHNAATWTSNTGTPTFNANGGTVTFNRTHNNPVAVASGSIHFNNVYLMFSGGSGSIGVTGTMYVDGTLTLADRDTYSNGGITSGTIEVGGNLTMAASYWGLKSTGLVKMTGTDSQTISTTGTSTFPPIEVAKSTGTLVLSGANSVSGWTWTSGTLDASGSTLTVVVPYNTSITVTPGTVSYNNVGINVSGSSTIVTINGTWDVNGNYSPTIRDQYGSCKINTGTFNVAGNLTPTYASAGWGASTCAIVMDGTGSITAKNGSVPCASLTVNTSGTVSLGGNLSLSGLTWTSGALDLSTYTLAVAGTITTGAGAEGLQLAAGGVLNSTAAYALTCRSLQLGSDTFAYNTYNVLQSYQSIQNNTVSFPTFFTGAGAKTIFVNTRPTVSITATTADAYELPSPQAGVFTVDRGSRTDGALIVNYTLASGGANATPGAASDYTLSGAWVDGAYSGSVTIPNGAVDATITVTPVDDVIYDPAETVIPTLAANANYTIGSSVATVTIRDNEVGNVAPVVSAGANQAVLNSALPIVATLNGSVTDDGQPTPVNLTKTWSQVSVDPPGGTASFTDATDPGTTVSFDQEGVYVLQLRGDDGALHTDSQVTISVYKRQVSVAVQDGTARATQSPTDTAAFRVSRPATFTGEDLVVNYTLGGTATVGTDYSILPLSGTVIIPQGVTYGDIVVTPVWKQDGANTVVLTLTAGPAQAPYEITGQNPPSACTLAKVAGPNRYWVAATPGGNWNSTANWSDESGGGGGFSVPDSGSVAIFDGGGAGNCALDAAVNVAGINIGSGHSGTITQGAVDITVGSIGWTQAGGTFNGGSNPIAINGPVALSGGTFKSTSGTLTHNAATWTSNTGTPAFNANGGKVVFTRGNGASMTIASGSIHFNNVDLAHCGSGQLDVTGDMYVDGNLTLLTSFPNYSTVGFNSGTIQLAGNLTLSSTSFNGKTTGCKIRMMGTGTQTISTSVAGGRFPPIEVDKASGTLVLSGTCYVGTWTWTQGTLDATGSTLLVSLAHDTSATVTPGTVSYNNVGINVSGGSIVTINGTWDVNGNYSLTIGDYGGPQINTGTFNVAGNLTATPGIRGGWGTCTCAIVMDGTGSITATGGSVPCASLTVNTSGTVSLGGNLSLSGLTWTSGALNLSSYTLTVPNAVTIGTGATTLGVTVADATTAGRLMCNSTVSGIANVGLVVSVAATEAQVLGQPYTILSNTSVLGATFESVTWLGGWKGVVAYTDNGGKNVTLSSIVMERGTVFRFR